MVPRWHFQDHQGAVPPAFHPSCIYQGRLWQHQTGPSSVRLYDETTQKGLQKGTERHQACPPDWATRWEVHHGLWVGYVGCCLFCISEHYTLGLRISLQSGNLAQSAGPWTSCPLPEQWRHPGSSSPTHGPPLTTRRACPKTLPGPPEPNTRGSPPARTCSATTTQPGSSTTGRPGTGPCMAKPWGRTMMLRVGIHASMPQQTQTVPHSISPFPYSIRSPKSCDARWNWWKMANWLGTSAPLTANSRAKYSICGTNMSRETSQRSSCWRLAHIWQVPPNDLHPTPAFPRTYRFPAKVSRTPAFPGTYGFPA